jgi:hypothetical protein
MMRSAASLAVLLIALLLAGCYQGQTFRQIDVGVTGPTATWNSELLLLEIGDRAWQIYPDTGGGVATRRTDQPLQVRLVKATDCAVLADFEGLVGHSYLVKVDSAGKFAVSDETKGAFPNGPGLIEASSDPCAAEGP